MAMREEDLWRVSRDVYFEGERVAATKSEWVDGVVYSMAGATRLHGVTSARILRLVGDAADALGCTATSADLLVATEHAMYYPDVVVSCHPPDHDYIERSPCFLAEVLSPSTQRQDRFEKREAYCAIESMRDYWIVDATNKVIEAWHRGEDGVWDGRHYNGASLIHVTCLGLSMPVSSVVF